MHKRRLLLLLPVLVLAVVFVLSGGKTLFAEGAMPSSSIAETVVQDDFSGNIDTLWDVLGNHVSVQIESEGHFVELTNAGEQVGTIWLKQNVAPPYTATFQLRIKPSPLSEDIADGMMFMFNKKQNLFPDNGGGMGFEVGNGYGLEFDTYVNFEDRSLYDPLPGERYVHTALFQNSPQHAYYGQLDYRQLDTNPYDTIDDGKWHDVRVEVGLSSVRMYLDHNPTPYLNYSGYIDPTYNGMGFSASTGAYFSEQQIKAVKITKAIPLFNDAVLTPSANMPTAGNVSVRASVYGVDPSATLLKWFPGRVEDPQQLKNSGTPFTESFPAPDNGTYTIFAQYLYGGEAVRYIEVTNIDRIKPTITYDGSTDITLTKSEMYRAPSFTLSDNYDTADQLELLTTGTVDMMKAGTYTVAYRARDRGGNVSDPVIVTIHVIEPLSGSADLQSLSVSNHSLNFSSNITSYTVIIGEEETLIPVVFTASDPQAKVMVNGTEGLSEVMIAFPLGTNRMDIPIVVTAENGNKKTYSLTLLRRGSSSLQLSALSSEQGRLSPSFMETVDGYDLYVSDLLANFTLKATLADPNTVLMVTGSTYLDASISGTTYMYRFRNTPTELKLSVSEQDGSLAKMYTVRVHPTPTVPAVAFASFNPAKNVVNVLFNRELQPESIDFSRFLVISGGNGVPVTQVTYTAQSGAMTAVQLYIPAGQSLSTGDVLQLLPNAALDSKGQLISGQTVRILHEKDTRQVYDLRHDGFHIDDVVSFQAHPVDLTGDGIIDRYDVIYLLTLLDTVAIH